MTHGKDVEELTKEVILLKKKIESLENSNVRLISENKELLKEVELLSKTEQALIESDTIYRTLAENLTEGVAFGCGGKWIYVNPALLKILKIEKEEFINLKPRKIIHKDHVEDYVNMINCIEKGSPVEIFTGICQRGDGNEIWIRSYNRPIEWQGETGLIATFRDITENKQKELLAEKVTHQLLEENQLLKSKTMHKYGLAHLIGTSDKMQEVYDKMIRTVSIDDNVVIYGESGTGKELVAKSIHELSKRNKNPFIAVNCGAIPETLFESEFFGHKKGAFTGANLDKIGFFESADKGTLFLDEIGEIPINQQIKLLRVIEGNGFTPVGDTIIKTSDVRIIAATNRDLKQLVKDGIIREDFFYRIHIIPIQLPSLKERKEDIPLLVYHFTQKMGAKEKRVIPDHIIEKLQEHDWPGNVRELQNTISRYLAFDKVEYTGKIKDSLSNSDKTILFEEELQEKMSLKNLLDNYEKNVIQKILSKTDGNKSKAARLLAIDRKSLQRKIMRLNIVSK
ncbi:MAG: PAS domain S-box protein [Desulfobacterales bacterium]|nr:PAS domain S-box protein [Desulfobacterales bacterium]